MSSAAAAAAASIFKLSCSSRKRANGDRNKTKKRKRKIKVKEGRKEGEGRLDRYGTNSATTLTTRDETWSGTELRRWPAGCPSTRRREAAGRWTSRSRKKQRRRKSETWSPSPWAPWRRSCRARRNSSS
ncbi:hypothetical protein Mapa_014107 [Marchantia paleacea]|nr:hypothetical protein Mapa_014107 [Marchantia paleacea]